MSALYYRPVYFLIVSILTLIVGARYNDEYIEDNRLKSNVAQTLFGGLLALFMIIFIGLRPVSGIYFVDMWNYRANYMTFNYGEAFEFTWETDNFIFDNLMAWFGSMQIEIEVIFFIVAVIYFGCMYLACRKLFPNDVFLSFLVYLGAFSTFAYGTNGIKAGAAASIFLVAIAYKDRKIIALLFLFLSLGFHHSMLVPVVAFIITYFIRNPRLYLVLWLICLFFAAIHVTYFMDFFSGFTDEHGAGYLIEEIENAEENVSGFRPDFILYSAIPIFLGFYYMQSNKIESDIYKFIWCTYTLTNCVFLLCTYGHFINRIAYLSWLMLPIVLIYPALSKNWDNEEPRHFKFIVFCHLGFTLFMNFIY